MKRIGMYLVVWMAMPISFSAAGGGQAPAISYTGPQVYIRGMAITALTPTNHGDAPAVLQVVTLAGSGAAGSADGLGTAASFKSPMGVTVDGSGHLYVAEYDNNKIRKITPAGEVTTLAGVGYFGSTDGPGTVAMFRRPSGVAVDGLGYVYVGDTSNHKIRKITPEGVVSTLAGSGTSGSTDDTGTAASFKQPYGVAVDGSGNVYVADSGNMKIRKITPAGVVTTFAGSGAFGSDDGIGTAASFGWPAGVAVDGSGHVYVSDSNKHKIRKITPAGVVTTLAGSGAAGSDDGPGTTASFYAPFSLAVDGSGTVYVADRTNNKIRKITSGGMVSTLAGSGAADSADGIGTAASFNWPAGVAVDGVGNVYVADQNNNKIRKISNYIIHPALPAGLSFNSGTGTISGTPAAVTTEATYTVTTANEFGTSTATITITVNALPAVTTQVVSDIGTTTATGNGTITDLGVPNPTEYGICWNTAGTPTVADSRADKGAASATGAFTAAMTDLLANTTYHVRAYAKNTAGTGYGEEVTFTTSALPTPTPTITPTPATVTDADGKATIKNDTLTAAITGCDPSVPVTLTTGPNGELILTIGPSGHEILVITLTGITQETALNVAIDQSAERDTIALTQPSGRVVRFLLVQYPSGSHVGLNLALAHEILGSVTNASGPGLNMDIQAQDSGGDITFTIAHHPATSNGTAKTVWLAPGGSMTIEASGLPEGGGCNLAIDYTGVSLGKTSESALRLMKVVPGSPLAMIGSNDRGNTAATATLGDYGIDTSVKKVWANVDTLGTFAVGVPKEPVEVVTTTVTSYGCMPLAGIMFGLVLIGFGGIKRG
jgi:hypothetical protein